MKREVPWFIYRIWYKGWIPESFNLWEPFFIKGWPIKKFSYLPESSNICAEANFFHNGFDRIDGIFYDTGNTRGPLQYGQEAQDIDVQTHVEIVNFTKNFWRDYVLDREAVVITNVGGVANPRQIMEAHHDSLTLKEHNIDQGSKMNINSSVYI